MKETIDYANQNYLKYVSLIAPKTKETRTLFRAFWVGGFICVIGQGIRTLYRTGVRS